MFKILKKHVYGFSTKLSRDRIDALAAQVAFFVIISFIPFTMFMLSILDSIKVDGMSMLTSIIELLPITARNFFISVFAERKTTFGLISITALTTLWSASMGMFSVIKGLNDIFMVRTKTNIVKVRIFSIVLTLVFTFVVSVSAVMLVFGESIYDLLIANSHPFTAKILDSIRHYVGFGVLFVFFSVLFKYVPKKANVKTACALVGSVISSLGWLLFSAVFSIFVEQFSNYAAIYGSLAAVIILMLWLYVCMCITFFAAEVSAWLQISSIKYDIQLHFYNKKIKRQQNKLERKLKRDIKRGKRIVPSLVKETNRQDTESLEEYSAKETDNSQRRQM